jgi:hypothetical protein
VGFQEAIQIGKRYLRLSPGQKAPIRKQHPPFKGSKEENLLGNSINQRLLNSFPGRKITELKECSRRSGDPNPENEAEDQMALVFFLTRNLLSRIAAPVDTRLIRDSDRLEKALEKIHPRLPISIRLILRKKRYIQFMMENRERLVA